MKSPLKRIRHALRRVKDCRLQKGPKTEKQEQNEKKHSRKETKHEKETEKPKESYSTYQFDDEILRKWMENARKQALRNVQEMINEFSNSSLIGFGAFFKTALMAIVIGFIFFIIVQILRLI